MSEQSISPEQSEPSSLPRQDVEQWLRNNLQNPHAAEIKISDLTDEDLAVWQKAKEGNITWQDVADYRNNLIKETERADDSVRKSRLAFQAIFADIVQVLILKRGGKLEG